MSCACPKCSGSPKPNFSNEHLLACEARFVLKLPTKAQRREYLEAKPVQARRKELEAEMLRQHAARAS